MNYNDPWAAWSGVPPNQGPASGFQESPGFKFARDQGLEAIKRQFAAKGMSNSGNLYQELVKYATGNALQGYDKWADRDLVSKGQDQNFGVNLLRTPQGNTGGYGNTTQADWNYNWLGGDNSVTAGNPNGIPNPNAMQLWKSYKFA